MKTPKLQKICAAILTTSLSAGCYVLENIFPRCPAEIDSSWVQEGALQEVYTIKLKSNRGNVSLSDSFMREGYFFEEKDQPENGYRAVLLDKQNSPIFEERFEFPHIFVSEGFPPISFLDEAERTIFIPSRKDAERIEIYNPSCLRILSINVLELKRGN